MMTLAWKLAAGIAAFGAGVDLRAGPPPPASPVLYVVGAASRYETGCFPPCACPFFWSDGLTGTFCLSFVSSDPLFDNYAVTAVDLTAPFVQTVRHITGSGTYRIGGEVALVQQLVLDLSTDGEAPQHFDSGVVSVGATFPDISIGVSMNNRFCHDTALTLVSGPTLADYNHDGRLDSGDVTAFLRVWFSDMEHGTHVSDFNGDGVINSADITGFLNAWFAALTHAC